MSVEPDVETLIRLVVPDGAVMVTVKIARPTSRPRRVRATGGWQSSGCPVCPAIGYQPAHLHQGYPTARSPSGDPAPAVCGSDAMRING